MLKVSEMIMEIFRESRMGRKGVLFRQRLRVETEKWGKGFNIREGLGELISLGYISEQGQGYVLEDIGYDYLYPYTIDHVEKEILMFLEGFANRCGAQTVPRSVLEEHLRSLDRYFMENYAEAMENLKERARVKFDRTSVTLVQL